MKVLIINKKSKSYGFVVDVIKSTVRSVMFKSPLTGADCVLRRASVTEFYNIEPRVGDEVIGLASASKEYYHTKEGFIGAIHAVDDGVVEWETLEVRGFSTIDPDLDLIVLVDPKHFDLRRVHPDNMAVALGEDNPRVVKHKPHWGLPPVLEQPANVDKPVKPTKAGGFGAKDNVKLSPESLFNDGSPANPVDLIGVVDAIVKGKLPVRVKWSNGFLNSYTPKDLIKG